MTTANDLVTAALRVVTSVTPGEPVDGTEAAHAFEVLNRMLKSWSASNLMSPCRTLEQFTLAAGINTQTIGSGAQLSTVRPDYITGAYLRDQFNADYVIDTTMTKEEYNAISLKATQFRPTKLYYDTQYPNGIIYFNGKTDQVYTLFLESIKPFNQFTNLQTSMALPGEFEEPIVYLLAKRIAPEYGFSIAQNPDVASLIADAEQFIKRRNLRPVRAGFDASITTPPPYNIYQG